MSEDATTTAEISRFLSYTSGDTFYGITVYTDRKPLQSGGLGKGKKLGTLVDKTLPELLRATADIIEQEQDTEVGTELVEALRDWENW